MNWQCIATLTELFAVDCIAVSADKKILASAGYNSLSIWHLPSCQRLHTITAHDDEICGVALTLDGRILVSASASEPTSCGVIKVWNTETGQELATWEEETAASISIAIHPNGEILAVGTDDYYAKPAINLWNLNTLVNSRTLVKYKGTIKSLAFSPDGKIIAAASGCDVQLCSLTGQIVHTLTDHVDVVEYVVFSPNGEQLASSSCMDRTIRVWNLSTGKQDYIISAPSGYPSYVSFSLDGKMLASNSHECDIQLWDIAKRELLCTLSGHSEPITTILFSQQELISSSSDRTVKIWANIMCV